MFCHETNRQKYTFNRADNMQQEYVDRSNSQIQHFISAFTDLSWISSSQYIKLTLNKHIMLDKYLPILFLLLCVLAPPASAVAYVASSMFSSYQTIMTGSPSLTSASTPAPFTVTFDEPHNIHQHAVVLSGFEMPTVCTNFSFRIAVSNTSSNASYELSLRVLGDTVLVRIQFFLILIMSAGQNYVQVRTLNEINDIYAPLNSVVSSGPVQCTTTLPTGVFTFGYYISYFSSSVEGTFPGRHFAVDLRSNPLSGLTYQSHYDVIDGTRITEFCLVVVIYTSNQPSYVIYLSFFTSILYTSLVSQIHGNSLSHPQAFAGGYNGKCIFGYTSIFNNPTPTIDVYDFNSPSPTLIYTSNNVDASRIVLCMFEAFNCSLVDPFCLNCTTKFSCDTCTSGRYVQLTPMVQCRLCSDAISYCLTCTNLPSCLTCSPPTVPSNGSCQFCSTILSNCLLCSDASTCVLCNSSLFILSNNTCGTLCSDAISGCVECSGSACLSCSQQHYIVAGGTCSPCYLGVGDCIRCSSSSVCLQCGANSTLSVTSECVCNEGYSMVDKVCVPYGCISAAIINQTSTCLACDPMLFMSSPINGRCFCLVGSLVKNVCNTISGCVDPVATPSGLVCLSCDPASFYPTPVSNQCKCLKGTLVNGYCNTIPGCVTPLESSCLFCSVAGNFIGKPDASGRCQCLKSYELRDEQCGEVCGDGQVIYSSDHVCDDGNTVSGDGCSSGCAVEPFYVCDNGQNPSKCIYVGLPIKLNLLYAQKNRDLNQAIFAFTLTPDLHFLSKDDFYTKITLSCPNTQSSVNSVKYSSGKLEVYADYYKDLEGNTCRLSITFNPSFARVSDSLITFQAQSRNQKLIFVDDTSIENKKTITFIFDILSYVALGVFLLSLGHKMIGVQFMFPCQVVYFSYLLYSQQSFFFSSITSFSPVTGYHRLFYQSQIHGDFSYPLCYILEMGGQVLQNTALWLGLMCLVGAIIGIVFLVEYVNIKKERRSQLQYKMEKRLVPRQINGPIELHTANQKALVLSKSIWAKNSMQHLYKNIFFPFVMFNIPINMVSIYLNSQSEGRPEGFFGLPLNSCAWLMVLFLMACAYRVQWLILLYSGSKQHKIGGTHQYRVGYSYLYTLKVLIFSFLLVMGAFLSFTSIRYIVAILYAIKFVVLLLVRPYNNVFSNLTLIFSDVMCLYALCLPIVVSYMDLSKNNQILLLLVLEGFISLVILMTIIRIVRFYIKQYKLKSQIKINSPEKGQKRNKKINKMKKKPQDEENEFNELMRKQVKGKHEGVPLMAQRKPSLRNYLHRKNGSSLSPERHKPERRKISESEEQELRDIQGRLRNSLIEKKERDRRLRSDKEQHK